jgi:hypothetical protein
MKCLATINTNQVSVELEELVPETGEELPVVVIPEVPEVNVPVVETADVVFWNPDVVELE